MEKESRNLSSFLLNLLFSNSLIFLLSSSSAFPQDILSFIDLDASAKSSSLKKSWPIKSSGNPVDIDISFHRLLLTLNPAEHYVTGSVTTYFKPLKPNLSEITFDLTDSLTVTAIKYHGDLLSTYTHSGNKLTIQLLLTPTLTPTLTLTSDSIQVDYLGTPPKSDIGGFFTGEHSGIPVLYTSSEPYAAPDWWPCRQDLNDKIDSVMLVVTVPEGYRAAANGMLLREQHCDDRSIYIWMHKHPITAYLVAVAVTNYSVYSDYVPVQGYPSIEILNYVYPEFEETARSQSRQIIRPFQIYNELFGLYPFADERYGHAQWERGGGMEHQTMSFMGSFGYDLMAHELAHQWFGDFVTCGSWRDIWLNEGFATYLTGLCYERDLGGIYWEPFKRLSINRVLREPGGSVYCHDTTDVYRIFDARLSYSKGAMVLHMLRWEMGDENFFKAVNNYLYDPLIANGFALTADLIRHAEAVADTSFQEFFNDWVYGEGYPRYEMVYRLQADNRIQLEISQEPSHPSVSFFEMHIPVRFIGPGRDTTMVFHHTQQGQLFTCSPGFAVDSVRFDPDRWICTANPIVLDVPEIPVDQKISVWPNPATDRIFIHIPQPSSHTTVSLIDLSGRLIHVRSFPQAIGNMEVPLNSIPRGTYLVRIESGTRVETMGVSLR